MKRILLAAILLAVVCVGQVAAQATSTSQASNGDVVVLNNGAVIKGTITERIEGEKIVVERADGEIFEIPSDRVQLVTSEAEYEAVHRPHLDSAKVAAREAHLEKWSSYRKWQAMIGGMYGEEEPFFSGQISGGVLWGDYIYAGISAGYDYCEFGRFLPVRGELRGYVSPSRFTPYFLIAGGYSIGWLDGFDGADFGGVTGSFGIGVEYARWQTTDLIMQLSYRIQQVENSTRASIDDRISLVSLMVGMSF